MREWSSSRNSVVYHHNVKQQLRCNTDFDLEMGPIYVVTALAITPSGTRRMVQAELSPTNPIANMPAALVMDGTCAATDASICFGTPHSVNYGIHGQDQSNAANL